MVETILNCLSEFFIHLYPFIFRWAFRLLPCPGYANNTAMNIGVRVSVWIIVFSKYMPKSEIRNFWSYQLTLCNPMDCSMPGFPVHHQLLVLAQTQVHRVSDAIQSFRPLSSPSPPASIFPSIRVFSNESVLHIRWPKYWRFSFSISPSNEYSELISFRMDWLDVKLVGLLAAQGTPQESSPTAQFKSINSLALSLLYGPTFTSIHDHWKNHSFD